MTGLHWKSATEPQVATLTLGERERCLNGIVGHIQTLKKTNGKVGFFRRLRNRVERNKQAIFCLFLPNFR